MTVPNVTMTWCMRKSTCKWCEQSIEQATPVVTVFFWNKGKEDNRRWNVKQFYHPNCWVAQGMDYLGRNPYVPRRREPKLCTEDMERRRFLIDRFHSLYQKRCSNHGQYPDGILREIDLTQRMVDTMMEVAALGGVPKGWAEKL